MRQRRKVLVFCGSVGSCRAVEHFCQDRDLPTVCYHGDMPIAARKESMAAFAGEPPARRVGSFCLQQADTWQGCGILWPMFLQRVPVMHLRMVQSMCCWFVPCTGCCLPAGAAAAAAGEADPAAPAPSIMVASDLAARGLDFPGTIDHVINFDFPSNAIDYLHRCRRVACACSHYVAAMWCCRFGP